MFQHRIFRVTIFLINQILIMNMYNVARSAKVNKNNWAANYQYKLLYLLTYVHIHTNIRDIHEFGMKIKWEPGYMTLIPFLARRSGVLALWVEFFILPSFNLKSFLSSCHKIPSSISYCCSLGIKSGICLKF